MEPCTTYQNTHHQLTVVNGSQRGKTCWPFRFKLMSNIKQIEYVLLVTVFIQLQVKKLIMVALVIILQIWITAGLGMLNFIKFLMYTYVKHYVI